MTDTHDRANARGLGHSVQIFLPLKLMSENHAYRTVAVGQRGSALHGVRTRRVMTSEAKAWKSQVTLTTRAAVSKAGWSLTAPFVALRFWIARSWLTQKGEPRKVDVSNLKLLVDAVCDGLGVDDSRVSELRAEKVSDDTGEEWIRVEAESLTGVLGGGLRVERKRQRCVK